MLADSVCGGSCTDFNEAFDRVLNELDFLKDKVQNLEEKVDDLEAQNLILGNKIQPSRELEPFTVKCQFNGTEAITVVEKEHEKKEQSICYYLTFHIT